MAKQLYNLRQKSAVNNDFAGIAKKGLHFLYSLL